MREDLLKRCYELYHKELVWYAQQLIGDFYSEDIVADAFIQAWETGVEHTNLRYFLYQSHRHSKYAYLKCNILPEDIKQHLIENWSTSEEHADGLIIKSQLLALLKTKVQKLPPDRRNIFDLIFLRGYSVNEIANITGLSPNTIRVQKGRIVKEFKIFGVSIFQKPCWVLGYNSEHKLSLGQRYKK